MDELFRSMESLLPILIFLIWIIASLANNKKRKSSGSQTVPSPHPSDQSDTQIPSSTKQTEKGPRLVVELKRSLETIFEEMGARYEQPKAEKSTLEPQIVKTEIPKYTPIKTAPQENKNDRDMTIEEIEKAYDRQMENTTSGFSFNHSELRRAVIWSEILSAPISLRE